MTQEINVDPEIVKSGMNRFGNTSELLSTNAQSLEVSSQCIAVPESVQAFQSALELALGKISEIARDTQIELGGTAQSMWTAAEELNAVDAELATSLQKAEGIALNIVPPAPPVTPDVTPTSTLPSVGGTSTEDR